MTPDQHKPVSQSYCLSYHNDFLTRHDLTHHNMQNVNPL